MLNAAEHKVDRLVASVMRRISSGALRPGDRLPSIREAADTLSVSKNTVVEAYLRLVARGLLHARPGAGYYVSRMVGAPARSSISPFAGIPDGAALLVEQLERRLQVRPGDGRLPANWLVDAEMRRALAGLRLSSAESFNYNTAQGFPRLRERLAGVLAQRGIDCKPDQILMTHGANHAMDLVIRSYVRPGDAVLVDDPGYYPLHSKLRLAGARVVGVRRDHDGPDVEGFAEAAHQSGARFFFTQSLGHNPTGGSLSLARAYGLLRAATENGVTIVEDDPFADIMPETAPRLAALDQLERVIYVSSFSKILAGSFRVGYLAARSVQVEALTEMLVVTMISTSSHNERLVHALMEQGHYVRHLRRLAARIAAAATQTAEALDRIGLPVRRPLGGGLYLWAAMPPATSQNQLIASAARRGIFIAPARAFSVSGNEPPAMRINIAHGHHPAFLDWLAQEIGA